ncbi:UDP-2,3-diacylglucosamine hydrolase [Acinetobacter calcoaceticus]|uniref:UDP-2,3-diacylglucosamine hydrolase n=1 Tax=Acinetobacter calcoaceticus TaxID=471 RepID=A0A4R1XTQ6_ACICA|nr:UDP-2,3-diacylglucosamine hydrolase [Acinetobacter calcoaceticus]
MTYLFISDLHLSPKHPRLTRGFLDLLIHYAHKHTQLYILGDWFDAWLGDDDHAPWLDEIVDALQKFCLHGNRVYFQAGNRDFVLGKGFLDQFHGILLPEVAQLHIGKQRIRLEHGDALCTDDVSYQRFRKIIRQPLLLGLLMKTPLKFRQRLAQGFRKQSQVSQQNKNMTIMDVNQHAVTRALTSVDILIHGHTHRPEIHPHDAKTRIVLGDWREQSAEAKILEINLQGEWKMLTWPIA